MNIANNIQGLTTNSFFIVTIGLTKQLESIRVKLGKMLENRVNKSIRSNPLPAYSYDRMYDFL